MKTLAIIGAGHLGRQIAHYATADGHYANIVFFDDVVNEPKVMGFPVLGGIDKVREAFQNNQFTQAIIGIGYHHLAVRQHLFETLDVPFATLIHSTSWVDPSARVEPGCVIYPGCHIDAQCVISSNTVLNIGCTVAHDTVIGRHNFLSPRVALAGFIKTGSRCTLGINSTVIDSITLASDVRLGGGTVVIKNLDMPGLYVGNPQRFVR